MKYFDISEFDSPDEPGSGSLMDKTFLAMLDSARERSGMPFVINSGYRTKEHNDALKASKTSSHLKGLAADISCKSSLQRQKIVTSLIIEGFTRLGIGKTFVHVDHDQSKPKAVWLY